MILIQTIGLQIRCHFFYNRLFILFMFVILKCCLLEKVQIYILLDGFFLVNKYAGLNLWQQTLAQVIILHILIFFLN